MNTSDPTSAELVQHFIYKVPKKNHEVMLEICKQSSDVFKEHGILRYGVYRLSNTDVPMEGHTNIATIVSANHEEEIWVESLYYRDRQHLNEVVEKLKKDERMGQLMKKSVELLPSGASFIYGEFDLLNI